MELRQLRYFVAVARHRHFTQAAADLHVAQPALSQQIRRLERELGLELLTRTTRRVALTEAGELLLPRARRVLAELDDARTELEELAGLVRGRVGVGTIPLAQLDLPGLLADFRAQHAGVSVFMREETLWAMLDMLRADELDAGFAFVDEQGAGADLTALRLFDDEFVVVTAPDHRLAGRRRVPLTELAGEAFIGFRDESILRATTEAALRDAGVEFETPFQSIELETMRKLAARGLGVTIMPRGYLAGEGPRVAVLSLTPPLTLPVSLVWRTRRRLPPAAEAFLAFARERLADA